jgi:DNA-binding CsgD family transcriptional regulator
MLHEMLTSMLLAATDFIEVASVACQVGKHKFGVHHSVVTLQALDGRPLIMVDDIAAITDDQRMAWVAGQWQLDPYQRIMREHHAPVGDETMSSMDHVDKLTRDLGYTGVSVQRFAVPILQPGELLGTIRCGRIDGFTPELRRDLTTLSCHVSVRLAQLGITTVPCPILAKLTPRQREVAKLAARGQTNADIGVALDLSENTVKKHLKDIFDLLEISNRTELAAHILTGPMHHVPAGVTRRGDVWITRAP